MEGWFFLIPFCMFGCFAVVFITMFVVVLVVIIRGATKNRQRQSALHQWAAYRQQSLSTQPDRSFESRFPDFAALKQGEQNRYALNVMTGDWHDRPIICFDYHYETTSTDSKGRRSTSNWYFSGVILESPVPLKPLLIRPESVFDKLAGMFGFDDIDFESAEFSRRFCVRSEDRRWAYDVLHNQTMEFLLRSRRCAIEFARHHVLIWDSPRFRQPDEFFQVAAVGEGVLDRLPDYLVDAQRADT